MLNYTVCSIEYIGNGNYTPIIPGVVFGTQPRSHREFGNEALVIKSKYFPSESDCCSPRNNCRHVPIEGQTKST